jgi:hypothetical protein
MKVVKDFLSRIFASPDVMNDLSFFKIDASSAKMQEFPCKILVKSTQSFNMPLHQGKMDAEYTTGMWSDAGVGVVGQLHHHHAVLHRLFQVQVYRSQSVDQLAGC